MSHPRIVTLTAILFGLLWPGEGAAAPTPIPVIELDKDGSLYEPTPYVSPGGDQMVTWMEQGSGSFLRLAERGDQGGAFGTPVVLSTTGNFEPPSITFTPDEGLFASWGIAAGGSTAEMAYRPAGGDFAATQPVAGCGRFIDSATGPNGEVAVACLHKLATNPPDTISYGSSPTLGPVTVNEDLVPPAYDQFLSPDVAWGPDGTIAIVSQGYNTTTNPPPANQTKRVRVSLKGPNFYTADVAFATWTDEVFAGPPVILDDGTVAVALGGSAGARVIIRPPGALTSFAPFPLQGEGVWGLGLDASQNLHAGVGNSDDREYWSFVKPADGDFGPPFAIPMPVIQGGDAYLTGFDVAADGTEYAVIRGDDGTYAASRLPGQPFGSPIKIGNDSSGNPTFAITPEGDLLATWAHENAPNDYSIEFGGLDKTPPAVTVNSFPEQLETGELATFSASATDAMGVGSLVWNFGGQEVTGDAVNHAFEDPGQHEVTFTATDVAGQQTIERRTVTVTGEGTNPARPTMTLKTPKRVKFKALAKKGLRVVVKAKPRMRLRVVLGTSKRNARLMPLRVKVIRKLKNRHVLRVKPRRARLGKRRKLRLYVQVTGTTAAKQRVTKGRAVKVRR